MPCEKAVLIAVENCSYSFDGLFTFLVPEHLYQHSVPGIRVLVPFGRGNVKRQGIIFAEADFPKDPSQYKYVDEVLDEAPLLSAEHILLAEWLRDTCFCTYFVAAKALLPGGMCLFTEKAYKLRNGFDVSFEKNSDKEKIILFLKRKKDYVAESAILEKCGLNKDNKILEALEKDGVIESDKKAFSRVRELVVRKIRLADEFADAESISGLSPKQKLVVDFISDLGTASVKDVCYYTGVTAAVVKRLVDKGVCVSFEENVERSPVRDSKRTQKKHILSAHQQSALQKLLEEYEKSSSSAALLFGVTGSGKTSVYLELIDRVLEDGKTALVLVPEISLTPQTLSLFSERYGKKTAVLHSGLSAGERFDEWKRIKNGGAQVVIGTRSAVFAPLENLGVIIIDEEQEHTYKSEKSPRYNAKDVARFRCAYNNALLVLASATPSVETYAKAVAGKYVLCELTERYGKAVLPDVVSVDMTDKELLPSYSSISQPLADELKRNLDKGEQSILLINRRGYNTFVVCKACKHVVTCPKCSISLTYHSANNRLMCHYCGYSSEYTDFCPQCGDRNIRYSGFGTQRVEQELKVKFPSARILRMDADTTGGRNAHAQAFSAFADGEYDIMLGTQMVAKGLDFPNVTLVGVTSADNELYNDDFRSSERTFDLITQVVGRAGRGDKKGRAVIQTVSPENTILSIASKQNYKAFFQQEMVMRKTMIYPPYCDLCIIGFSSFSEALTEDCARGFFELLKAAAEKAPENHMIVLGPLSPRVAKINDCYRQRIIIKCRNTSEFRSMITGLLKTIMSDKKYKNVGIFADINPENTDI